MVRGAGMTFDGGIHHVVSTTRNTIERMLFG